MDKFFLESIAELFFLYPGIFTHRLCFTEVWAKCQSWTLRWPGIYPQNGWPHLSAGGGRCHVTRSRAPGGAELAWDSLRGLRQSLCCPATGGWHRMLGAFPWVPTWKPFRWVPSTQTLEQASIWGSRAGLLMGVLRKCQRRLGGFTLICSRNCTD